MHRCECNHVELRYCSKCDKVYCTCGKEWGGDCGVQWNWTYELPATMTTSAYGFTGDYIAVTPEDMPENRTHCH